MVLTGCATFVGYRSGNKNGKLWCSLALDALDNPLERIEYFVPDDLVGKVTHLTPGPVKVTARLYPVKGGFGSRLVDIEAHAGGKNG